jgi:hypothetical protein
VQVARTSLDRGAAKLLYALLSENITERKATASNAGRVNATTLIKAGLVVRSADRLELSDDARFSLGLS